jgi:hypothetical protein
LVQLALLGLKVQQVTLGQQVQLALLVLLEQQVRQVRQALE